MLVVWLTVQSAVIGLVPSWGAFVAHSHLFTGAMTQADWDAHEHAHRLGMSAHNAYEPTCAGPNKSARHVFASLPDVNGITSWLPALTATLNAHPLEILATDFPSVRVLAQTYSMRDRFDPPLEPPPNACAVAMA
jgi:hypothetical protein